MGFWFTCGEFFFPMPPINLIYNLLGSLAVVGFSFGLLGDSFSEKKIELNGKPIEFEMGDNTIREQFETENLIWTVELLDNYSQQFSLTTTHWDTLLNLPSGAVHTTFSFWRRFPNDRQQFTCLNRFAESKSKVGCFSPSGIPDTTLRAPGKTTLFQYGSLAYYAPGMTTVRMSSFNNNQILMYCFIGSDSVLPVALNTDTVQMPAFYKGVKNLKTVSGNSFEMRGRWNYTKLFFAFLPYKPDSIRLEIFNG